MKKINALIVLVLLLLLITSATQAATVNIPIDSLQASTNTNYAVTVKNLTDSNLHTLWETTETTPDTAWAELRFIEPMLIEGLQLNGCPQGEMSLQYWDGMDWYNFIASHFQPRLNSGWNLIDLSYDQIVTDKIRIYFTNPEKLTKLGGINEVKVLGQAASAVLQKLEPVNVAAQSDSAYPVTNLFDHNTYTPWKASSGLMKQSAATIDLGSLCAIERIKVYSEKTDAPLKIEYSQNGEWQELPTIIAPDPSNQAGWRTFALSGKGIKTAKLRLTLNDATKLNGPRELEIWGCRLENKVNCRYIEISPEVCRVEQGQPLNYRFTYAGPLTGTVLLHLTATGNGSLESELNGVSSGTLKPVYTKEGKTLYQQVISAQDLMSGENYLGIRGSEGTVIDCRLETEYPALPDTPITDRWTLTPAVGNEAQIALAQTGHLDEVFLSYLQNGAAQLSVDRNGNWVSFAGQPEYQPGEIGGDIKFGGVGATDKLKVGFYGNVTEIRIDGSPVTDGPPQIQIMTPTDGTCLSIEQYRAAILKGIVDNPEATVTVNGRDVQQNGQNFEFALKNLDQPTNGEIVIEVKAVDQSGRSNTVPLKLVIGEKPAFILDLPDETIYTRDAQITVSGRVSGGNCRVTVNGIDVPVKKLRFSTLIALEAGLNRLTVTVTDRNQPNLTATQCRRVVRVVSPPVIIVDYPVPNQIIADTLLTVTGRVDSLAPGQVMVNGIAATVDRKRFTADLNLKDGDNRIIITAQDRVGQSASVELTVRKAASEDGIIIYTPGENAIVNTTNIQVTGKIAPSLGERVIINGEPITTVNGEFSLSLQLKEGENIIAIQAGKVTACRKVTLDTIAPAAFQPAAEYSAISKKYRINFSTTDTGSGVAGYEIAVDNGPWVQGIASPYQLPEVLSSGEHRFRVKAVDQAGNVTSGEVKIGDSLTLPVNFEAVAGAKRILLYWGNLKQTGLSGYRLTRTPAFSNAKDLTNPLKNNLNAYIDKEVEPDTEYTYTLQAIDENGNLGEAAKVTVTAGYTLQTVDFKGKKVRFDNCEVDLSENAVNNTRKVMINELETTLPEAAFARRLGPVYSLKMLETGITKGQLRGLRRLNAQSPDNPEIKAGFQKPVYLRISYADMQLPQDISPLDLSIYWFNHGTNHWERVSGVQNDLEKQELSVQLQHFSEYQVMASQYEPPTLDELYKMGVSNYVPYFKDNAESISPSIGNLTVIATDLKLPGRAGFDLTLKRLYNSKEAEQDIIWSQNKENISAPVDTFGFGWSLNIPWLETNSYGTYVKFPEGYRVKLENTADFTYHQGIHFNFKKVTNGSEVKYVLTLKDGSAYEFKTDGRVIKYSDPMGKNAIQFTYKDKDEKGRQLDEITDSVGRKVKFTYALIPGSSSIYTISKISTGITKERAWKYRYNSNGCLIEVEAPKACKTVYGYTTHDVSGGTLIDFWNYSDIDEIHNYSLQLLNSILYPSGGKVNFKIDVKKWDFADCCGDPMGNPYRIYRKVGYKSLYTSHEVEGKLINYSFNLNIKSSLDYWNLRIASIYILSSQVSIGGQTTVDTFKQVVGTNLMDLTSRDQGSQGTLVVSRQVLLNGKEYEKTDYDYDMNVWDVKTEKHYRNNNLIYQYDSTYDAWGNLTSRTDTSRNINETWNYRDHSTVKNLVDSETTIYNYLTDKEKKVMINNEYHASLAGKLTRQTVQADGKNLITDYTYDPDNGNVLTMTKFPGTDQELKTLYTYDAGKNFPVQITLKAIKDADGKTADINTYYQFDYDTGQKIAETDARGYLTIYKYDELNRLIKAVLPDDENSPEGNRPYREYLFDDPNNRCDYYNEKRQHTRFEFDVLGRITGIIKYTKGNPYPVEVKTTYKYDVLGRVASVTDPRGNADPTLAAKYTTWYDYDPLNRVTKVTFPDETPADLSDNPYATLSYDDSTNTVTIVDENGKGKTVERKNWLGQLVEAQQYCEFNGVSDTYKWQYAYDSLGGKVKETGPDGYTVAREYDSLGKLIKATFPSATLVLPNSKTPVEHQPVKVYEYDLAGNKVLETSFNAQGDKTGNYRTDYRYDQLGRLIETTNFVKNPSGASTPLKIVKRHYYDAAGNKVKTVVDPNGKNLTYLYTYSVRGWLLSETDPMDRTTRYRYDVLGNKIAVIDPRNTSHDDETESATGGVKVYQLNKNWYDKTSMGPVDPRSNKSFTTWYLFDELNQPVRVVLPDNTPPANPYSDTVNYDNPYTETKYDATGNKTRVRDANGVCASYEYSPRNFVLKEMDNLGRVQKEYTYDQKGQPVAVKDALSRTIRNDYDSLGRVRLITDPAGYQQKIEYDSSGNKSKVTDARNNTTQYFYNGLGWLTGIRDPLGNRTDIQYDPNGNKVKVIAPNQLATVNTYDELNRVVESRDQFNVPTTYKYDIVSHLAEQVDRRGSRWVYQYDNAGRMIQLDVTGQGDPYQVKYEYDEAGNSKLISDSGGSIKYNFKNGVYQTDSLNRINSVDRSFGGATYRTAYKYNNGGMVTDILYPEAPSEADQYWLKYRYNNLNQLNEVTGFSASQNGIVYNTDGSLKNLTYENNASTTYNYDLDSRLDDLTVKVNSTEIMKLDYAYDGSGNVTRMNDRTYNYDNNNQLIRVYSPDIPVETAATSGSSQPQVLSRTEDYEYDAIGNRTLMRLTQSQTNLYESKYYTYNGLKTDRLMTDGKYAYEYDQNGNLIKKGNKFTVSGATVTFTTTGADIVYWEYKYNLLNQLIKVTKNGKVVSEYQYDPTGLRVVKTAPARNVKTHYVFEGTEPIFEKNITTGKIKSYVYALGKHLARVDGAIGDSAALKYFYHVDLLGSVKIITDQTGKVVYKADFHAFGNRFGTEGSIDETHGFNGKEYDEDTGLYYYNARWYDPDIGRFIAEDPAIDPNNPNLYSFCGNNPVNRMDPDGRFWNFIIAGLIGGICSSSNGGDFFQGFVTGVLSAGVAGAVNAAVSSAFAGAASATSTYVTGIIAGGMTGGIMSTVSGGDFWSGFGTGAVSAGVATYLGDKWGKYVKGKWQNGSFVNGSIRAVNAFITGGDPLQAFAGGYAESSLNYIADTKFKRFSTNTDYQSGPTLSEAADIADDVYNGKVGDDELSGGWKLVEIYSPEGTGLRMGVYARVGAGGKTEYVIANKGTSCLRNWSDNIKQLYGKSPDMWDSIKYAIEFVGRNPDADITFVGHSKGGAEAAANAVATNRNAILFNPATVNLRAYKLNRSTYTGNMTAYIVKNEPLNYLFDCISIPIDDVVYLPQQSWNPIYNHSMAGVKKAIKEWEGM